MTGNLFGTIVNVAVASKVIKDVKKINPKKKCKRRNKKLFK